MVTVKYKVDIITKVMVTTKAIVTSKVKVTYMVKVTPKMKVNKVKATFNSYEYRKHLLGYSGIIIEVRSTLVKLQTKKMY